MDNHLIYVLSVQTKQSVEAFNPLARLLSVEEIKSAVVVDHLLSAQPERYNNIRLKEHEFLIAIQCQYGSFKKSVISYHIINLDEVKAHHNEPPYILLQRFLTFDGVLSLSESARSENTYVSVHFIPCPTAHALASGPRNKTKLNMLDTVVTVHDVPSMFKSMVPEDPRNRIDIANSKLFQDEARRYIEIDIRVDQSEASKPVFEMLSNLPSFVECVLNHGLRIVVT